MNEFILKVFSTQDQITEADFEQFYSLMKSAFPKSERRSKQAFRKLCKTENNYKIFAYFTGAELSAFLTVWEFEGFTFGDHFAVLPSKRGGGIGSNILSDILGKIKLPFIIEVESPETEIARRRIGFYERLGLKLCDFDYILPAMQKGCDPLPMKIMAYPCAISQEDFEITKQKIYSKVYNA